MKTLFNTINGFIAGVSLGTMFATARQVGWLPSYDSPKLMFAASCFAFGSGIFGLVILNWRRK